MAEPISIRIASGPTERFLALGAGGWMETDERFCRYRLEWKAKGARKHSGTEEILELAPICALRFPEWPGIESARPEEVLEKLAKKAIPRNRADALAFLFKEIWNWLLETDGDLHKWAIGITERHGIDSLALLSLAGQHRFDALSGIVPKGYVPLPPKRRENDVERFPADVKPDAIISTAFKRADRLERAMNDFEYREEQAELARHVWKSLSCNSHLIIEAGTGIGKSLAYLIPAVLYADCNRTGVVVSTNTINLQEQLLEKDIQVARKALPEIPFSVALLKGRSHYFCRLRAREALFGRGDPAARVAEIAAFGGPDAWEYVVRLGFWQAATEDGDMDRVGAPPGLPRDMQARIQSLVDCGTRSCLRNKCQYREGCWFYAARDRAEKCHILVMNHALLFRLLSAESSDTDTVLSKYSRFVLDEAHNIEDALTDQYTGEVSGLAMMELSNRILRFMDDPLLNAALGQSWGFDKLHDAKEEVRSALSKWMDAKREIDGWAAKVLARANAVDISLSTPDPADAKHAAELNMILQKTAASFARVRDAFERLRSPVMSDESDARVEDDAFQSEAMLVMSEVMDMENVLGGLTAPGGETIRWAKMQLTREGVGFRCYVCPLEVGGIFREFVESRSSVILTSATLTVARGFDFMKSRLGLDSLPEEMLPCVRLETPFDIAEQARLCIPTDLIEPDFGNMQPYIERTAAIVCEIAQGMRGGTLVLFNSNADMTRVYEIAAGQMGNGLKVLCQGVDGSRTEIGNRLKKNDGVVLFGTKSFWEGFDIPGEALRCVVLTRLPFANFKEPVRAARAAAIRERGGSEFMEYAVPQAAMRLAQGFGRLIRTKTDRGCIFVLDTRIVKKRYGQYFLKSLPDHIALTGKAEEVVPAAVEWYWEGARG
ncbi:MAG: hypothetical protein HRF49_09935 [bacterium]|jgi:ATP-dependent DNA helicase DinG